HPIQIGFITGEGLDEMAAWHASAIYTYLQRATLKFADFSHLLTHAVSQPFDHASCEAYSHELILDDLFRFDVIRCFVPVGFECDAHFCKPFCNDIELSERLGTQVLN